MDILKQGFRLYYIRCNPCFYIQKCYLCKIKYNLDVWEKK